MALESGIDICCEIHYISKSSIWALPQLATDSIEPRIAKRCMIKLFWNWPNQFRVDISEMVGKELRASFRVDVMSFFVFFFLDLMANWRTAYALEYVHRW